jgi:4-amino-4-deoxy-L-arabinose transferase-like glycosyltransferase/phage pi2 protein 07
MRTNLFKNKVILILLGIILLSTFLRFYKLGEKSFSADEFLGVNTTYGYLQTGEWKRWDFNLEKLYQDKPYFKTIFDLDLWKGGEDTYTRAWIYNWQVAQSLKALPDAQEWSYRVVGAIWGVLSVLIIYLIATRMSGRKEIGLIAAVLMAVSIDSIEFSRKVRMYVMFMPIFLSFTYFAFKFIESKRKSSVDFINKFREKTGLNLIFIVPAFILGLLSIHLHLLAGNFLFILLAYIVVMWFISYKKDQKINNRYFIYLILLLIGGWLISLTNKAFVSGLGIQDHFSYFDKSFSDYSNSILAAGLMAVGAHYLIKSKLKEGVFLTTSYLVIFLGAVFLWDRNTGSQYIYFAKPFQIILIAGGIWAIASFLRENLKSHNKRAYLFSILALLLIVPNLAYFFQDENTYTQTSRSSNPSYNKVFGYFIKEKSDSDVLISRNFRNFYWRGSKTKTYSLGGERATAEEKKLTQEKLNEIMSKNSSGWIIYSDNDESFISKEAEEFIEKKLEKVSNSMVRGPISVYRWR